MRPSFPPIALPKWPAVGALPKLAVGPREFLDANQARHGDIFATTILGQKIVFFTHPRHVQHIRVNNSRKYSAGKGNPIAHLIFPDGIITTDGKKWRDRRRAAQPYFTPSHLETIFPAIDSSIRKNLTPFEESATNGAPCNIRECASSITISVITEAMLGARVSRDDLEKIISAIDYITNHPLRFFAQATLLENLQIPWRTRAQESLSLFSTVVRNILNDPNNQSHGSILRIYARDPLQSRAISNILELILAGYESTECVLTWILLHIAHSPDLQRRLALEIDQSIGNGEPDPGNIRELKHLHMTLHEALRMYPPAYLLWSQCTETDTVDDLTIEAGTRAVISIFHTQRHPSAWTSPGRFVPARFEHDDTIAEHRRNGSFTPFGTGSRQCIGQRLANSEILLAVIRILQRYRLCPTAPTSRLPNPDLRISLRPLGKIQLLASHR
ncbi:MAG: cytochrome P450 [Myxococcales bacterium]|nr:cytochrome P450 [Myxococcales bacterium]MCB9719013.1 cytochrome P450 [Myxococcales bacterium]